MRITSTHPPTRRTDFLLQLPPSRGQGQFSTIPLKPLASLPILKLQPLRMSRLNMDFTGFTMLNLVYFIVPYLKKYFLLYLSFLCPQIYHLMNNNSSTEAAKFACDFVVLLRGESVCENSIRPKTTEILRSNLVVSQNVYLELANNIWTTK